MSTRRLIGLAAVLISIPTILIVDLFLTPWRVPSRILYAIPIMITARFYSLGVTLFVVAVALAFSVLDMSLVGLGLQTGDVLEPTLTGLEFQTEALSLLALIAISLLSILWSRAEHRIVALAEEQARLREDQQDRANELEESRASLLEFFSMVAHDLRSPLTAIQGFVQLLYRSEEISREKLDQYLAGIEASTRRLLRLSNDLSDASRIGTGRFDLNKEICDLVSLCGEIVEQRRPSAPQHRIALRASIERLEGRFDCDRIAQVVGNLVDNAIKYSPEGGDVGVFVERGAEQAEDIGKRPGSGCRAQEYLEALPAL